MSQKVPFDLSNVKKCVCPGCPVQAKSGCVAGLKKQLAGALAKTPPKKEEIPGAYCATGRATCTDLDPSQPCQCGGCPVFSEYNLASGKPAGYYCRDGQAM
ncbi:MAG: DUF2769 domain-containing protein [Deltaproteobacteria bacterium HGW-Deltaproteobacteria-15]|jgi:hypothetical protein|nr:MAG: DUF2769 domain-containing protein [Deltaproteobacteria bacterium HGW-Deltaproteobacteria-15]